MKKVFFRCFAVGWPQHRNSKRWVFEVRSCPQNTPTNISNLRFLRTTHGDFLVLSEAHTQHEDVSADALLLPDWHWRLAREYWTQSNEVGWPQHRSSLLWAQYFRASRQFHSGSSRASEETCACWVSILITRESPWLVSRKRKIEIFYSVFFTLGNHPKLRCPMSCFEDMT